MSLEIVALFGAQRKSSSMNTVSVQRRHWRSWRADFSPASPLLPLTRPASWTNVDILVHLFAAHVVFTVSPLNPSLVLFSVLSSSGSGASQALLMLHRFYGVTEQLNFAPLSAALSNYRFCRDTPPSKQPLCLIICDRKRIEKGTLVKLMWILSSSLR